MDTKKLNKEYARLAALFKGVDKNKLELVDELLKKAAFLKCELDDLQTLIKKKGAVEFSNKGNSRQTPVYKTYLTSLMAYQTIIKTLNSILGKNVNDDDDEFDEFMKSIGN